MPDSTKNPISILLRAPVTMKIGPVPADLTSSDQIMSFGLNNFARILSEKGIAADVHGQFALGSFSIDGGPAAIQPTAGKIGGAHVCTPVTHAHLDCRIRLDTNKHTTKDIKPITYN